MGFFSSFFGSDQKKAINKSHAQAQGYLDAGNTQGQGQVTDYYNRARTYIAPYTAGGAQANQLLGNYLGANGADAQRQAFANFANDPGFQAQFGAGINALDRSATARGGLYSGAQMKGIHEFGQQFQRQAYNDRINQLMGYSGQGQQAALAGAGLANQTGTQLGNMSFGYGQQSAANAINKGNALAQASNTGWNNLIGLAGVAAKAFGMPGTPKPGV